MGMGVGMGVEVCEWGGGGECFFFKYFELNLKVAGSIVILSLWLFFRF